ncbi:MAG: hypothetical protein M0D53_13375 [Flavobacterium sp. JAD_PAG50586_2]|nr:MAG: hypothetical protein M0D53_13375 [Flavobacterium sp. JAD_PAG50586_2]
MLYFVVDTDYKPHYLFSAVAEEEPHERIRAVAWGAITEDEVLATGLTLEEIRGRSFKKILENRAGK